MKTTILMNVYNAEKHIDLFFESLKRQTYKDFDLFIVDDGSTDNTIEKIYNYRPYFKINLIKIKHSGIIKARSQGSKKIHPDIMIILDIDLVLTSDSIEELINKLLEDEKIAAVGGVLDSVKKNRIAESYGDLRLLFANLRSNKDDSIDWVGGGFCAFKKKIFDEAGGFTENLNSTEDLEISWRLKNKGYEICRARKAIAFHADPTSFKDVWKRDYNVGRREYFLSKQHKKQFFSIKRSMRFYPFLLPVLLILFFLNPLLISGLIVLSFIPFILILKSNITNRILAWFTFNVMNFAYCYGFFISLIGVNKL